MPYVIRYHFSQHFAVSAQTAYVWCTNFTPNDHALMGNGNAKREVMWLTDSTVIVKDTFPTSDGAVEKQKLVQLYPYRLTWVSTHLSGLNKYSQFIYEISVKGACASQLDFNALHMEYQENIAEKSAKLLTKKLCKTDSNVWKLLSEAMKKEHNQ